MKIDLGIGLYRVSLPAGAIGGTNLSGIKGVEDLGGNTCFNHDDNAPHSRSQIDTPLITKQSC